MGQDLIMGKCSGCGVRLTCNDLAVDPVIGRLLVKDLHRARRRVCVSCRFWAWIMAAD